MLSSSVVCSYSGGSEELSDDITQQQLLPGVKYVNVLHRMKSIRASVGQQET